MATQNFPVKLTHPTTGESRTASDLAALRRFEFDGFRATGGKVEQFDPSQHSVADVESYLAGATPAERVRVLDAEKSGRKRPSLLSGSTTAQSS